MTAELKLGGFIIACFFIKDITKQEPMLIIRIMFDPIVSTNKNSMKKQQERMSPSTCLGSREEEPV